MLWLDVTWKSQEQFYFPARNIVNDRFCNFKKKKNEFLGATDTG